MMCYKGRTFCGATTCKHFGNGCDRSYTPEVHADAVKWWGGEGAPVSKYVKPEELECYEKKTV